MDRSCAECGTGISYSGRGQPPRYCSPKCKSTAKSKRLRAQRAVHRETLPVPRCATCNVELPRQDRPGGPLRYCSERCREDKPVALDRRCARCGLVKLADHFQPDPRYAGGLRSWCNECYADYRLSRRDRAILLERRSKYGISIEDQQRLWEEQGGKCKACGAAFQRLGEAHLDHDHSTGYVRAYLCAACNRIVGACYEDLDHLIAVAEYLVALRE